MVTRWIVAGLLGALLCGPAGAQQFKWTDASGRTQYGDTPPPGVKATRLRPPPAGAARSGAGKSAADPEAEFQRRRKEATEARAKVEADEKQAAERSDNCARARAQLAQLEGGGRIASVDSKGERYFLDDKQRAAEATRARDLVGQWCK